jgi:hypothetical protein
MSQEMRGAEINAWWLVPAVLAGGVMGGALGFITKSSYIIGFIHHGCVMLSRDRFVDITEEYSKILKDKKIKMKQYQSIVKIDDTEYRPLFLEVSSPEVTPPENTATN